MGSLKLCTAVMMVVLGLLASGGRLTEAQAVASCAQKLIPCQPYLNTTGAPPGSCCDPIKEAVQKELTCLCNLYNDPNLLQSLGVNVTQAIQLSQRCGVTTDLSDCKSAAAAPTGTPPPGVPGSDGCRMAWTGLSSLLLVWVSWLFV